MEGIESWKPESFQSTVDEKGLSENLNILAGWLKSNTPPGSFGSLSSLIGSGEGTGQNGTGVLHDKIRDIHRSISTTNKPQFIKSASKVVGLGSGLTPSGDDFLTGMSLTVARYSHIINKLKEYSTWFEPLSPLINAKTTILSSALFSASLQGSADERLIQAFDAIVRGNMVEEEIIPSISSWGSSSGFDALAGFFIINESDILMSELSGQIDITNSGSCPVCGDSDTTIPIHLLYADLLVGEKMPKGTQSWNISCKVDEIGVSTQNS